MVEVITGNCLLFELIEQEIGEREELLMSLTLGKAIDKLSDNSIQDENSTESGS